MQTIAWNKHGDSLSEYTLEEFCFFRLFAGVNEHQKKKKKKKNRTLQLCSEFCTTPISVWRSPTQLPQQQLPQKQLPQNPDCRFDTSVAKCDWRKINWSKQIVSPPLLLLNKRIINRLWRLSCFPVCTEVVQEFMSVVCSINTRVTAPHGGRKGEEIKYTFTGSGHSIYLF